MRWYVARDGKSTGPVSEETLMEYARAGRLSGAVKGGGRGVGLGRRRLRPEEDRTARLAVLPMAPKPPEP
jgi:hypothetical protein